LKLCALFVLFTAVGFSQNLSFYLDNSTATGVLQPLPATYSFSDTPEGAQTSIYVRVVNTSNAAVQISAITVAASQQFTVVGFPANTILAPQGWKLFTVNFSPTAIGPQTANLQLGTPGSLTTIATLSGNAVAPQVTLSCKSNLSPQCDGSILQAGTSVPISFGSVLTTGSASIPFTLQNNGGSNLDPQTIIPKLSVATNNPNTPFALSTLPASLPPGSSVTFTVTFAPGTASTYTTSLIVGSSNYALQGIGAASVIGDLSSLVITYTDSTGIRLTAQPSTPINAGQVIAGTNGSSTLTFSVLNPQTTISPVSVPVPVVTGGGFAIAGASAFPAVVQPGSSATFQLVFSPSSSGKYAGTLSIGTRQFAVTAQSTVSPIPTPSFQIDLQPLSSQHQAHLTVQLASPSPVLAIGTLSLSFTPAVSGISDDPAINFVATNGRNLQLTVASGSQAATYNGQSSITFQTGTTAGTLTFALTFPNSPTYTQSFTITPAQVQINSSTAQIAPPNLILTLVGYDDTYSVGQLTFSFKDTSGKLLTPTPLTVDATSNFHQYFFGSSNQAGGGFSVVLTFPVSGNITEVGSVTATLQNSAGQTSVTQAFQ
jgi:hypothetical protein